MKVAIHDLTKPEIDAIIVETADDPRLDATDRSVAELAFRFGEVMTMGWVIAEPIPSE